MNPDANKYEVRMINVNQKEWKALLESDKNAMVIDSRTSKEW